MTELTEIDGVGPSYAESLTEQGYDDAEDVAAASPDDIDDADFAALSASDVVDAANELTTDDTEPVEFEADLIDVDIDLDEDQRNHLIAALVNEEMRARKTNKSGDVRAVKDAIRQIVDGDDLSVTLDQLNAMYRGVSQLESEYRSQRGVGSFVTKIRNLKDELQSIRQENWPE